MLLSFFRPVFLALLLSGAVLNIKAQNDSISQEQLDPVLLMATKIVIAKRDIPISISKIDIGKTQNLRQQLSFNEYLTTIPGLFVLNANNFSQDLRISIRGFGARSAFGIRGVKLIVDGIPETTPDGQGQIDNLNLEAIESIEVIRGPASLLYGNASGGVVSITTLNGLQENQANAAATFGAFRMQKYQFGFGLKTTTTDYLFQSNLTHTDGYREFSGFKSYNFNGKIKHSFSESSRLTVNLNYTDSPFAEDPGSLNAEDLAVNRRQARQRNKDFQTQESVRQTKAGANFTTDFNERWSLSSYGFLSARDFDTKLPFENGGVVDLQRFYFGHGSSLNFKTDHANAENTLQLGYDLASQSDQRQRFDNVMGEIGERTLNQEEGFDNYAFYILDHLKIGHWLLRGGLRFDFNRLKVEDDFLQDGNDSDTIDLSNLNGSFGINYTINKSQSIFGNLSTSFETPVLSELSANPQGNGGFNQNLEAQTATNYELGYRYQSAKTRLETVVFYIDTSNDIVPFELQDFPDREFFRNAGSSIRRGFEFSLDQYLAKNLDVNVAYTYSDFEYGTYEVSGTDFSGNRLPAIPKHLINAQLNYLNASKWQAQLELTSVGRMFADDGNTSEVDAYAIVNLRLRKTLDLKDWSITPFVGANNLLDQTYNDNIRINAFGGRYFEAAPGIHLFGGLRVGI